MRFSDYAQARLVAQRPDATVYEAVRAMESNHIGAVLVQDRGRLVGVVTDRDIALRVVGAALDPQQVRLEDIMSRDVAALPVSADEAQVLELMRTRCVRRIALMDGDQIAGIVTLDDLLLTGAADREAVAAVVRAQLTEPAPLKAAGLVRPSKPVRRPVVRDRRQARRAAHVFQTSHRALGLVRDLTGLDDDEQTMLALEVVVSGIARRLTVPEAGDLLSQLPLELRDRLGETPFGPDPSLTRETIESELARRLDLELPQAAALAEDVGLALTRLVSPGEIAHVRAQLPRDLQSLLPDEVAHPTP